MRAYIRLLLATALPATGSAWPYGRLIPPLPAAWRSTVAADVTTAYFVGNDTGLDNAVELAAEARWGIIGIGWQLNGSWATPQRKTHVFGRHVEAAERETAAALKSRNPKLRVLLGRNTEVAARYLHSVAAVWNRTDFWLKCPNKTDPSAPLSDCVSGWGSWAEPAAPPGSADHSTSKKFFDFSQPALRAWYAGIYLNASINDPLFDGVFFDCGCGHPRKASAFGDAAYATGYQEVWQQVNAALAAKGRWGTAWAGPNMLNPTVNTAGQNPVCEDLMPRIIELGQANGTSQFVWKGNMLGHNTDRSDNFTLYLAGFLLGKGASSTLTAHVTGGYDASVLDQSGFANSAAVLNVDYGQPLEQGACVGGLVGRKCPSLTWTRRLSKSTVTIRCDNVTGAATAWIKLLHSDAAPQTKPRPATSDSQSRLTIPGGAASPARTTDAGGPVVFRAPVLVGRSEDVPCGKPHCRPHCPGCYAGNTPVVDQVTVVSPGVLVAPWTSGYPLGQVGNLAFAISLTNGASWSNRTVLPPTGLLGLPNYPWVWTASPGLGLLNINGGCNASLPPGNAVAAQCPQFECSAIASPAYATLFADATAASGISLSASCGQIEFRGFPHPLRSVGLLSGWGDDGGSPTITTPIRLPDGSWLMTIAMTPADELKRDNKAYPMNIVVWRSEDRKLWQYLSVAVNHTQIRGGATTFGPSEHDLSLLSDNKTLMMVMRTDGDGHGYGCPAAGGRHPWHFYYQTYSTDQGRKWSEPRPIQGAGSVRPRLLLLESRALVMAGGRMCKSQAEHAPSCPPLDQASGGGVFLWVNEDGMADLDNTRNGSEWVPYCVTAAHNRLWHGDPALLWDNTTGTQAYTSVVALGPRSVGVAYAHGETLPHVATFMIRADNVGL